MWKTLPSTLLPVLVLLAALAATPLYGGNIATNHQPRFLVFTSGEPQVNQMVRDRVAEAGGRTLDDVRVKDGLGLLVVRVPGEAARDLAGIAGVREVSREIAPRPFHDPIPWGVDRIEAECVWGSDGDCQDAIGDSRAVHLKSDDNGSGTIDGTDVVVAVTDTGVQLDHPDLFGNTGKSSVHADCSGDGECTTLDDDEDPLNPGSPGYDNDGDGHGTHVSGTVAATHNDEQVIGVSPEATILSVNCFEPGTFFSCLRAVRYAGGLDSNGDPVTEAPRARVVNMSWGWSANLENQCPSCVETIDAIMEEAWDRGLLLLAAAGNGGTCGGKNDSVGYPARLDKPTAVAATTTSGARPCFSSTGPPVGLAGPGANVLSTTFGGGTGNKSGTSMATPHVSGVGALVFHANSDLTNGDARAILLKTAQDLSGGDATEVNCGGGQTHDTWFGCGLARADRAVAAALDAAPNAPPSADAGGPYSGTEDSAITFDGSGSADPDGDTLSYTWDFGDGASATTNSTTISHTYLWGGTFTVTLTVSDGKGGTDTDTSSAGVTEVNDPPVADPNGPYSGTVDQDITFDGSGSSDFDNEDGTTDNDQTLTYKWDFGDGTNAVTTSATINHSYSAAGDYTVTLIVNDGIEDSESVITTATISDSSDITLSATGYKVRGLQKADLEWSGATSTNVDVYRDGSVIAATTNDGFYTDNIDQRGSGSYTYQVCEADTSTCSNAATVTF